jgi:hypothetical protein
MALTIDTEREIDYDRICALIDRPKKRSPAGRGF